MQFFVVLLAVCCLLAGRALSLNITIGSANITASQFLLVNDTDLSNACQTPCGNATTLVQRCTDTNDACLCSISTATAVTACEQCFFATLIQEHRLMPNPLAGNSVTLTNYSNACNASLGTAFNASSSFALAIPSGWNGPFGQGLSIGGTVVAVGVTVILGAGAIAVVNTM